MLKQLDFLSQKIGKKRKKIEMKNGCFETEKVKFQRKLVKKLENNRPKKN